MSTRYDSIDNFWFVLRHEVEHVLRRDGIKNEAIDDPDGATSSSDTSLSEQERAANRAAADCCAPSDKVDFFIASKRPYFCEKDVLALSRLVNRHPGLVVGPMQSKLKDPAYLRKYQVKIRSYVLPDAVAKAGGKQSQ